MNLKFIGNCIYSSAWVSQFQILVSSPLQSFAQLACTSHGQLKSIILKWSVQIDNLFNILQQLRFRKRIYRKEIELGLIFFF